MGAETKRDDATIRAFRTEDAPAVTAILRGAPEAANWTEESYRESLSLPGVVDFVSEGDGRVTGFLIGRQVADDAEILNLAVAALARGRGEGGALLRAAIDEFRVRGVSRVFLEVRESNATGIAFYEKRGFFKTGRRAGYYRESEEAAIVMEMRLTG
jgi:[ribosomal protein S18]-alanine N-acetyltransferase